MLNFLSILNFISRGRDKMTYWQMNFPKAHIELISRKICSYLINSFFSFIMLVMVAKTLSVKMKILVSKNPVSAHKQSHAFRENIREMCLLWLDMWQMQVHVWRNIP